MALALGSMHFFTVVMGKGKWGFQRAARVKLSALYSMTLDQLVKFATDLLLKWVLSIIG